MESYLEFKWEAEKHLKIFDELNLWSAPFGLKLLDFIEYKPGITAIDLGFGTGFPLIEIAMRLGNSSTVYGIDGWKEIFDKVKEKINCYGVGNIKLIEGNVESIPLEDNFVDLITSNNCINNVQNINKAIMECSRILRRNGQFIHTMNLDKSMFEFYNIMEETLLELNLLAEIDLMHKHIEERRPSVDKIINPMKSNFIIKDVEYDQFSYKFSNGTAMLNHHSVKASFMDSWKKILPDNMVQEIFKLIESKLNKQAEELGGIKLSIPFVLINGIKK
jgi:ubiquinone/menaquinone biosynthesis C-methylase UbiE